MKSANRAHDRALLAAFVWPRSYQDVTADLGLSKGSVEHIVRRLLGGGQLRFAGFGVFNGRQRAMYVSTGKPSATMQETFESVVLGLPEITVQAIRRRLRMSPPEVSRRTKAMVNAGKLVRVNRAPALWVPM